MTISTAPETAELYRRLFRQLMATFRGSIDDANADAIAYAAAELYHRQVEPKLWQEKSAHELLDLFGVPRAGVFAPYSLSERLVVFRRRSSQSECVSRAHELLTALGVPRLDDTGNDRELTWRLQHLLAGDELAPVPDDEKAPDGEAAEELDVDVEPAAAPLADAVRALEQAARVEAELSQSAAEGPGGVDLVTLAATLSNVQAELAALRALVEALGVELRERLESIHEELLTARGVLEPPPGEPAVAVPVVAAALQAITDQPTTEVPPVPPDLPAAPEPDVATPGRRWFRRVLLVVLLTLIAFAIAAVIVGVITFAWNEAQST